MSPTTREKKPVFTQSVTAAGCFFRPRPPSPTKVVWRMSTFVIYIDHSGDYRWYLMAEDNRRIAESARSYRAREDCERDVKLMKRVAPNAKIQVPARVETLIEQ